MDNSDLLRPPIPVIFLICKDEWWNSSGIRNYWFVFSYILNIILCTPARRLCWHLFGCLSLGVPQWSNSELNLRHTDTVQSSLLKYIYCCLNSRSRRWDILELFLPWRTRSRLSSWLLMSVGQREGPGS